MVISLLFFNQLFESVVKNLPIFIVLGEGKKSGGTHVTFLNPKDVWILFFRWRDVRLKKDHLEETTGAGILAPTTQ